MTLTRGLWVWVAGGMKRPFLCVPANVCSWGKAVVQAWHTTPPVARLRFDYSAQRKVPMSAKKIAKKKAKPAAKRRAKRVPKKMAAPARERRLPRKEDVPGYTPGLPDEQRWPEIAIILKVKPFYTGKDSVPFSRLRARGYNDPADFRNPMKNEFYLVEAL